MASKEVMLWRNITLLCSRGPRRRKRDGWSWSIWGPPPPLTPLGSPLHPVPDPPQHCTRDPRSHPPMVPTKPCQHRDTPDYERSRSDSRTFPHTGWSSTIQTAETVPRMAMPPLQRAHHRHPHLSHAQDWGDVQYSSSQEEARERTQAVLDESQADKLREKATSKMEKRTVECYMQCSFLISLYHLQLFQILTETVWILL